MNRKSKIKHLKRSDINSIKWDRCINLAFNGMVYGYSWYLDIVCEQWEGLVFDDYDAVMPLVCSHRWGVSYIYQPAFSYQMGVFSCEMLDPEFAKQFVDSIPGKYKYVSCPQNIFVPPFAAGSRTAATTRHTFLLDLIRPYNSTLEGFAQPVKDALTLALSKKTTIVTGMNIREVVGFYKEHSRLSHLVHKAYDYEVMRRIANLTIQHRVGELYAAFSAENQLLAITFFVVTNSRAMMLFFAESPYGQESFAMHLLINYVASKYSEKNITLFFEAIEGTPTEELVLGFGAQKVPYPVLQHTKLPWPAKFFR